MSRLSGATRITLIYVAIGVLWILFSDVIALNLFPDIDSFVRFQVMKGWFYVAATGALLYVLIRRHLGELDARDRALNDRMLQTTRDAQDILREFSDRMKIFKVKAERTEGFDPDLIALFDSVIDDTERKVNGLGEGEEQA